jgi:acetyltransferase-like isoleucine patch superfamily enzyme
MDDQELEHLIQQLRHMYARLRTEMQSRWQRDLPLDELLFDRWERARALGFGNGTSVYHNSYVYGDVKVGEHTWIGPYTLLDGSGGLTVGHYCSISTGVQIYTHDTVAWALSGGQVGQSRQRTTIGSRCYIGPNTVVGKGVTIGDGCVIGANSLVIDDIPAGSRAFGTPCRVAGASAELLRQSKDS